MLRWRLITYSNIPLPSGRTAAVVTFQGGSAVPFTESVSEGDQGETTVAPRRNTWAGLAAVRGLANDLVENRSLILRVFLPFVAGYYIAYLFRTINAVLASPLAAELGLGADDLGLLTSVYFLTFAAAQIPIGILLDRYGPRRIQSALLLVAAGGSALFAVSEHFVNASVDRRTTSPDRVAAPASSYVVQAGNVIPASLITGIRSDLPGQITAQVTENVYDSPTGRFLLIPQGTRLIGVYDSQVAFGQSRVLLVWSRLIMPNGRSTVLERQPGADTAGYSGLEDGVDNHWGALFRAALLSTLLGVGSELGSTSGTGTNSDVIQALRRGSSDSLNQSGQQVVRRNLNIQPTLTIRPGFPVRVIVNRDLALEPYKG